MSSAGRDEPRTPGDIEALLSDVADAVADRLVGALAAASTGGPWPALAVRWTPDRDAALPPSFKRCPPARRTSALAGPVRQDRVEQLNTLWVSDWWHHGSGHGAAGWDDALETELAWPGALERRGAALFDLLAAAGVEDPNQRLAAEACRRVNRRGAPNTTADFVAYPRSDSGSLSDLTATIHAVGTPSALESLVADRLLLPAGLRELREERPYIAPREACGRAEQLWACLPTRQLGEHLEPLVRAHVDLVVRTMAAHPPIETAYCLALDPVRHDEEVEVVEYAYGLESDRAQLMAEGDHVSVWNAALFNHYIDAVEPKPAAENPLRRQLNEEDGIVEFDTWLSCEVARRLNRMGAAPAGATPDFVVYHFDYALSDDFQLGLAYGTPAATYERLAAQGLVAPEEAMPGPAWLDFGLQSA